MQTTPNTLSDPFKHSNQALARAFDKVVSEPKRRTPSKVGEPYMELLEIVFYGLRMGKSCNEIAKICRKKQIKKRNNKIMDANYVFSTARYYNLRNADTLDAALAMPRVRGDETKRPRTKTKAEPEEMATKWSKSDLQKLVMDSELRADLKVERFHEIEAGLWVRPINSIVEMVDDQLKFTVQSIIRTETDDEFMLDRSRADALVERMDELKHFVGR